MSNLLEQNYKELQKLSGFIDDSIPVKGIFLIQRITSWKSKTNKTYHTAHGLWRPMHENNSKNSIPKQFALFHLFNYSACGPIDITEEKFLELEGKTIQIEANIPLESKEGKPYPKIVWNLYNKSNFIHPSEIATSNPIPTPTPINDALGNEEGDNSLIVSTIEVEETLIDKYHPDFIEHYYNEIKAGREDKVVLEQLEILHQNDEQELAQNYQVDEITEAEKFELNQQTAQDEIIHESDEDTLDSEVIVSKKSKAKNK